MAHHLETGTQLGLAVAEAGMETAPLVVCTCSEVAVVLAFPVDIDSCCSAADSMVEEGFANSRWIGSVLGFAVEVAS